MRRLGVALLLAALVLTGCETNAQRSARLAKLARHPTQAKTGLVVARENPAVKVLATAVLHDENGTAAVVTLRNESSHPLRDAQIAITLHEPGGRTLYQNNASGLSSALVSVPLLMPGQRFDWIDDQIQANGTPGALSVRVGAASTVSLQPPRLSVQGVHLFEDPANGLGAEGTVVNQSSVAQRELVVFAVGRHAGKVVAAGRAVLPNVPANSSASFQVFFIGNPRGASLQLSAPPTTAG